jgi:formyltetrahydrofolate-dependent phosphoribosylglycinamide formyltransferase
VTINLACFYKVFPQFCSMLKKLQGKWKVNTVSLVLILITFATGGSLCGWLGKKLLGFTGLEKGVLWFILYIIIITLLWPLCVLAISIPLGQFKFFKNYIRKIFNRMAGKRLPGVKSRVAIFASGAGSNAEKIIRHFEGHPHIEVALVVCNKPGAGVIGIGTSHKIPVEMIEKDRFFNGDGYMPVLKEYQIDSIVLAGFLWKIPAVIIREWKGRIVNIHPALLPAYGGKGMYGARVHEAVIAAGEKESGISIHEVDEIYDNGAILFQASCKIEENDTPESLAKKIHALEHQHFPSELERFIMSRRQ